LSFRIPWAKPTFGDREREYVVDALTSSWVSGGPYVERFEHALNRHMESSHGLTVSNGTAALHLALLALGIGPGDEVIVPDFSFVAPGNMVRAVGATPVFADIDSRTWCLDPADAEKRITARTRAIVTVHLYGNVSDMDGLLSLTQARRLLLVEDVAEAAFSRYRHRYAGTFGDAGCFSFQATKTITTGEGGYVTTGSSDLDDRMRIIRDHGMRRGKRYWHDVVGHNFRLTNLQAALGLAQFESLDRIIADRQRMYRSYAERLAHVAGVTFQYFPPEVDPVVWAVALRLDPSAFRFDRDGVISALAEIGIETRPGFYPFSVMPLYESEPIPIAERIGATVISVPSFPTLTDDEIGFVCDRLKDLRR
jgi:perosamine synthetase